MIYETYLANIKNVPKNALRVRVCRPSHLGPSVELLHDWKEGKITWEEYKQRYIEQLMGDNIAINDLFTIASYAGMRDVYLYCYEKDKTHCHRSILLQVIRHMIKGE